MHRFWNSAARRTIACALAVAGVSAGQGALAHHPGSHADRLADGRVRIEVATLATDACTRIASVAPGTPPAVTPPPGSAPVTARLERPGTDACATVVTAVKSEAVLDLGRDVRQLFLYILAPDGTVAATERVPVR